MKKYEVEVRRTSYIIVTVEADDVEQAEERAWQRIEADNVNINDAAWELESIEEIDDEA